MTPPRISRRALLLSSAAAIGCGRKKPTGFPGYCFVANRGSRSVTAVDLNQFRVRTQIPLDAAPSAIVALADADKPRVYVLAPDTGAVYEIDVATLKVSRRRSAGGQAAAMRFSPRNDSLWVLYREPSALVELPLASFRPARRIPLPAASDSFDLSEDGRAAIASRKGRAIYVASLSRAAIERTITPGGEPALVQFRKDGQLLMTASPPDRSLAIYDVPTGRTVVRLPLPLAPRRFCVSPDGGQLFITGEGMDAVVIAFPYSTEIDQTVLAGHAPGAMAVTNTANSYLLVANPDSGSITALDMYTRRLVAVVQVGQAPAQIVLTPDHQYAMAIDEQSGDLAVIRLSAFSEAWVRRYKSASLFTIVQVGDRPAGAVVVGYKA